METGKNWIKHPKSNPPPEMELVEVRGDEWSGKAMKKTYKKPHSMPSNWRWVDEQGRRLGDQRIYAWREIIPQPTAAAT